MDAYLTGKYHEENGQTCFHYPFQKYTPSEFCLLA